VKCGEYPFAEPTVNQPGYVIPRLVDCRVRFILGKRKEECDVLTWMLQAFKEPLEGNLHVLNRLIKWREEKEREVQP